MGQAPASSTDVTAEPSARRAVARIGCASAGAVLVLSLSYLAVLAAGFMSLRSAADPIGRPWLLLLEILIILLQPALVILFASLHQQAAAGMRAVSLSALVFAGLTAGTTTCVHAAVLALGEAGPLAFRWPSAAYVLDVMAWDVFFATAMLLAAPAVRGGRLAAWARRAMVLDGLLSLAGLWGAVAGDMQLRNIGIAGYAGVTPIVAALLALHFRRGAPPYSDEAGP